VVPTDGGDADGEGVRLVALASVTMTDPANDPHDQDAPTGDATLEAPTLTGGAESVTPGPSGTFLARLDEAEERFVRLAAQAPPTGLTEPDEGAEERWEAGQVWAHVTEFPTYWMGQVRVIVEGAREAAGDPVPFGRTKADPTRLGAIEQFRDLGPEDALERLRSALAFVRQGLMSLPEPAWGLEGRHSTRGVMTIEAIVRHFICDHLDEHADQLDRLAAAS
jgi:hypothetical protein